MIRAVTVYCSSSRHVDPAYLDAAARVGTLIGESGWRLVYGGNRVGCMGALADAARVAGAKVTGITPQRLVDEGIADELCDELLVTAGMRERKQMLEDRGDALVVLPGGVGTLEEFFEVLVGRLLGYHAKPIVLLNLRGFYDPLLALIDHAVAERFAKPAARSAIEVASEPAEVIELLRRERAAKPAGPTARVDQPHD